MCVVTGTTGSSCFDKPHYVIKIVMHFQSWVLCMWVAFAFFFFCLFIVYVLCPATPVMSYLVLSYTHARRVSLAQ